jgi:hypothetical protein
VADLIIKEVKNIWLNVMVQGSPRYLGLNGGVKWINQMIQVKLAKVFETEQVKALSDWCIVLPVAV